MSLAIKKLLTKSVYANKKAANKKNFLDQIGTYFDYEERVVRGEILQLLQDLDACLCIATKLIIYTAISYNIQSI